MVQHPNWMLFPMPWERSMFKKIAEYTIKDIEPIYIPELPDYIENNKEYSDSD